MEDQIPQNINNQQIYENPIQNSANIYNQYQNINYPQIDNQNLEKTKRHRRGKNETNERNYRCPDCDKCYLSGPALTTHRKTKHGYGTNGEKKARGRPRKDFSQNINNNNNNNNAINISAHMKFSSFFMSAIRKPPSLDQTINDKTITLEIIIKNLELIFKQCQSELFKNIKDVKEYSFYELIVNNWEKEEPEIQKESYSSIIKNDVASNKIDCPNLDGIFYLYLKSVSKKTNTQYFWFVVKFIVLFREYINFMKKNLVKKEDQTEKNIVYSQIYNAETVPEICNDFFVEFMDKYKFFGLNQMELIELVQHFCYWLYSKQYTQAHLTLLEN